MNETFHFLTDAQLKGELDRCVSCREKPCQDACPADCSPADFIMAARGGAKSDFQRSAAMILRANPLGGVCGAACPDVFCMKACSRRMLDRPIEIPAVQAAIVEKAKRLGLRPPPAVPGNGKRVAVVGAGPAGLSAAAVLAQRGYRVTVFDARRTPGGMMNLIPEFRLPRRIIRTDIDFVRGHGAIEFRGARAVPEPAKLLERFGAVIVSAGLGQPITLGIPGEERVVPWQVFLEDNKVKVSGKRVAILGGGAVAADCATTAARRGAASVELVYRRRLCDMPITAFERRMLLEHNVEISTCVKPLAVVLRAKRTRGLSLARQTLPRGNAPRPENFVASAKEPPVFREFDVVISAVGNRGAIPTPAVKGLFYAGDLVLGSSTVVESVASGKNAAAAADAHLRGEPAERIANPAKSRVLLTRSDPRPVPLDTDFFGRRILSPLLLSAAPHTDGYEQVRAAYEAGWAGGVMKTAFDNVAIHIPGEYMFVLGRSTYGNCDNVSAHPLDRVCDEVERLVREYPDRLTMASTGGPVTGCDEADRAFWQSNTAKLEASGAMGVEYSLSCPQGGDGTNGDLVSQSAELTAKVVSWVMETGSPDVPKLFKLTGAVTAIQPIIRAVQEVLAQHPRKKAGVTLANSFPSMAFRPSAGRRWDEGVLIGMSGEGVLPISNLTLARVAGMGITVSGNGGAMTHRDAANFLALGAGTVQFCTAVMKYGLGYVGELHSGLSHLMEERGIASVRELVGSALPGPIADFAALSAVKKIPSVAAALCAHCGNCAHCPYQAVAMNAEGIPGFNAALCVGCSLCAQKCFAGALTMRARSAGELAALAEG